jgi:hypothetical protein
MKRLLFALMILIPIACFGQGGSNVKAITSLNIANVTGSYTWTKTGLSDVKTLQVQVDWVGLTGTLDGYLKVLQRGESSMAFTCLDTVSTSPSNMKIVLSATTGHYTFTYWAWGAADVQILFVKNNCTGGIINASYGARR